MCYGNLLSGNIQNFLGALDLPEELLHGIEIQFSSGPTILFKFVEQIDIDTLIGGEYFKINREEMLDDEKRI